MNDVYIPQSMQPIADIIGTENTRAIIDLYGGCQWQCPQNLPIDHPLYIAIGHNAAMALCHEIGGVRLDVPIGDQPKKNKMIPLLEQGLSYEKIAKQVGCHRLHVLRTAKQLGLTKKDMRQQELF